LRKKPFYTENERKRITFARGLSSANGQGKETGWRNEKGKGLKRSDQKSGKEGGS